MDKFRALRAWFRRGTNWSERAWSTWRQRGYSHLSVVGATYRTSEFYNFIESLRGVGTYFGRAPTPDRFGHVIAGPTKTTSRFLAHSQRSHQSPMCVTITNLDAFDGVRFDTKADQNVVDLD